MIFYILNNTAIFFDTLTLYLISYTIVGTMIAKFNQCNKASEPVIDLYHKCKNCDNLYSNNIIGLLKSVNYLIQRTLHKTVC